MVLASRLQDTIPGQFSLIADRERQQRYNDGILFNGHRCHFPFAEAGTPQDLILIATKATALDAALDTIAPYVGPDTLILSLLNGITSEKIVSARFGAEKVLYSHFLGHTSTRQGDRITHDGEYHIYFGEADNRTLSGKVLRIKALFDRTGIRYRIPEDMLASMWQKFTLNIGCNQTTALLRQPYGHIQQNPKAMALTVGLMEEAAAVARKLQIAGHDTLVQRAIEVIRYLRPEDKSSMLQDVEAGRPSEIDQFAGTLCRLADSSGIPAPLNSAAWKILSAL